MAILQKRTSKQTPTVREVNRAPLNSIVRGVGQTPAISRASPTSITSAGGVRSVNPIKTTSFTPAQLSPAITNKIANSTKTTSPNLVVGQTIKPNVSNPNSTVNKVTSALSGAAVGAGTKLLIDKIKDKINPEKIIQPDLKPGKPQNGSKKDAPITSVVKPSLTETEIQEELDRVKASELPYAPPDHAVINADGTSSVAGDDMVVNYNPDGSIAGADPKFVVKSETTSPAIDDQATAVNTPETEYFEDADGNVYTLNADGSYSLYSSVFNDNTSEDNSVSNDTYTDPETGAVFTLSDSGEWVTDYEDSSVYPDQFENYEVDDSNNLYAKRGGLIAMMKQGGIPKFSAGGDVEYNDNGDGTYSYYDANGDYVTVNGETGDEISRTGEDGNVIPQVRTQYTPAPSTTEVPQGGLTPPPNPPPPSRVPSFLQDLISQETYDKITGALPAAGAGALVGMLLGQNFSGGTGNQNQGLDMSKVGVINPRTTDFGIGPTNYVGYDQYGTSNGDYTPNDELLQNLNAPGYNPVNEGDYDKPPIQASKMASGGLSSMSTPVASYYTFGQPADILANLGMRPQPPMNPPEMMAQGTQQPNQQMPQQGQQSPLMAQQAAQGMSQPGVQQPGMPPQNAMMTPGLPPQMRKGGLPHFSDVPMAQGRMDFRQGAAVHGAGDGQSDDIPAMLADGEYVIDAETVAQIGNGSTKAGAQALDRFREGIRAHKRSAPIDKIPPKTKVLTSYLKGAR